MQRGGGDLLARGKEREGVRYRAGHEGGFGAKEVREKVGVFEEERTKETERQTD